MKTFFLSLTTAASAIAALPSVGPDYQRPDVSAPAAYRDITDTPSVVLSPDWWRAFNDPVLDELEARALAANQDLRAALARVEQARALAGVARSAYLPSVSAAPSVDRERTSRTVDNRLTDSPATTHTLPLNLSWELDLFGRVRRLNESARAEFAAAGATYHAARLALTAEVATTHFTLRAIDEELRIVNRTVGVRRDALSLTASRFKQGTAGELDVARAETELASTEADAAALAIRRASTETALAVLLGEAAPSFSAGIATASVATPGIPAGLPSDLLTRRPDIAVAERALAAASARIGVAKSSFFPAISLTGSAGYASADISDLFKSDSRLWSIGPSLYLPLFQGGRNKASLARSRAAFEESLAVYRQRVLIAFREVQDALTASRLLEDQAAAQARAVESARRGAKLSQIRYDAGYVSYFEVVDAQRTALDVERADARLTGQRWITRVSLIKALGGGWSQPTS
ncbi:MAG: efflux system, outer rane lipoprotein NodT family [Rariglobus sp.]|jgi:multidrug efflux system outer membrane protein|nr:efflux system, outer rane lipoprotein NodT family [Rariglobus sp.]